MLAAVQATFEQALRRELGEKESRLERERRVLQKQSRAILKLPIRKEREELAAAKVGANGVGGVDHLQ